MRLWLPLAILILWCLAALVGPWLHLRPDLVDLPQILRGPGAEAWLGFDDLGRPVLDRLVAGARNSFIVAFAVVGISIAVAIAIHNIPEGISVSVPVYYATGSRKKAFYYSFLSGVSEPLGALIGYAILYRFFNDFVFGLLFAMVAGIMVFISLDELLPSAQKYGEHHLSIYGMVAGMAVMALSLLLFI